MDDSSILKFSQLPVTEGKISDFADDPVIAMRRLWAKHGNIAALQEDTQRLYFIFGPEYNKQVLSDSTRFHSKFFALRGSRKSAQRRITSGLLSMNGDEHKEQRRMVKGPFQKKAIEAYHSNVTAHTNEMLSHWQVGETRDMAEEMTGYMLSLTSSILFGLDFPELASRVGKLTEEWVSLNHKVGPAAFTSDPNLAAMYDELLVAAERLEEAVIEMIDMRRSGKLGTDVLSILIRMHDQQGGITDAQLTGHIVLLFGAAHLTSAHTLTWTLFLLSQHPEVMQKLYAELDESLEGKAPLLQQLEQLPYLDQVLKESMRVMPASSYSQRIAAETVELGPFKLNPGAVVIFSQFMTHHLPELFPEPEKFIPERWETITPSPYAYLPFGAGPRMCIGAPLGMMQLKIALPQILQRFKLNVTADSEIIARIMSTMLFPVSKVPMQIQAHDGNFNASPVTGNIHTLVDMPAATQSIRKVA